MTPYMKELYDESTLALDAMVMTDDILQNQYTFIVDNDPFPTKDADIPYIFTLPIPDSILNACGNDYGYEIFMYTQQQETLDILWPIIVLIDSFYNETAQSLTAEFFPNIWMNKTAEFIISCTPGNDRITSIGGRRRLSHETVGHCPADPIHSPLTGERVISREFSRRHVGVDYAVNNDDILAAANGTIQKSGDSKFYGPRIILKHDEGMFGFLDTFCFFFAEFENRFQIEKYKIKCIWLLTLICMLRWSNNI